jgi:hypothetical protein
MAHLWSLIDSKEWMASLLDGDAFVLRGCAPYPVESSFNLTEAHEQILLMRLANPPETWALVGGRGGVRVNGSPLPLGLAVLDDRDELRVSDEHSLFFSTEHIAKVERYPDSGPRGFCPRCKLSIESGSQAVRCPGCSLWHHHADEMPCWTYAPTCAACAQPTALDAGFRWTPEDL